MNRGEMRTETRDIIGEDVEDFWKTAELNRYLTEANYRFHNEERWPWLISEGSDSLVADNPDLEFAESVSFPRHINITLKKDGETRTYQPRRVDAAKGFQLRSMYTQSQSYPAWFYVISATDGGAGVLTYTIRFVPTPVANMTVDYQYVREPDPLNADSSTPDMPVEFHKALVHHAAGTAWLKELNGQRKAEEQFALYAAVVDQCRSDWLNEPDDQPIVMGRDEPQWGDGRLAADAWLLRMPETIEGS